MFLDHTQRRTTVGRTPLNEWLARRRELSVLVLPNHQHTLKMGAELFPETSWKPSHLDAAACQRKFHWIMCISVGTRSNKLRSGTITHIASFLRCWTVICSVASDIPVHCTALPSILGVDFIGSTSSSLLYCLNDWKRKQTSDYSHDVRRVSSPLTEKVRYVHNGNRIRTKWAKNTDSLRHNN